jgi:hypothetical protein
MIIKRDIIKAESKRRWSMLTFTPEACQYALHSGGVLYLEYLTVQGCCIPYQPGPSVRFGNPHDPQNYRQETIEGMTVFVPLELPEVPLRINLNAFMGFKRLVVEGWRHA